jgi:hypothetical protein
MTETPQCNEEQVIRRMLAMKPKPHKDEGKKSALGRTKGKPAD